MKDISKLIHVIAFCLPFAAIAQDRVTIDGILSDGTPAPQPPPKVSHSFKILSTEEIPIEKRKLIIHRVENPGFPDPAPPAPRVIDRGAVAAFKNSPAHLARQVQQAHTTSLFLSASVVDNRATLLRWWDGGKEYQAWSNVNFKHLTGFSSFSKGARHFATFMGVGDVSSASLREGSIFRIPSDLPTGAANFIMVRGAANESEGYGAIVALHELYASDGERLREAYVLRMKREKDADAKRRANPPAPKDIVLNFWKVESPKERAEAQAPLQEGYRTKGGGK